MQYFNNYPIPGEISQRGTLDAARYWTSDAKDLSRRPFEKGPLLGELFHSMTGKLIDEEDRLAAIHPIYTIPSSAVEQCYDYFAQKEGF